MAEVLGRGTIEIVADARKLKAGIEEAKKSIRTLGEGQKDISKAAAQSIDRYIGKLNQQNAALGKSTREIELYKLALRGASNEQIKAADAALRFGERQKGLDSIAAGFRAVGGAIATVAAALAALAAHNINALDRLNDLSKSTGIAVEDLAGLSLLAKQTGVDMDSLATGINRMSVEMGKSPEKFRALGVTAKDSVGAFKQLADIFNQLEDVQQRNALAQKIFSKSWQELAPALSEGSKGIQDAIDKGTRLSGITTEMARAADEFNDRLEELKISSAAFGAELLPHLTGIVTQMIAAKEHSTGFFDALIRFLRISGEEAKKPAESIADIDAKLIKLRATAEEFAGMNFFKRIFSADDIAIVNTQIDNLLAKRSVLAGLPGAQAPELGSHLTPAQDAAAEAKRVADARSASARARGFLAEGADTASQEKKARLALDLENIRKAGEAQIAAFSNAEKIMEAMRAAALVDDKDYYASKQAFIRLNAQASETALQEEIARLQRETFAGKTAAQDRLANQKAIAEAQAKLNKVRADSAANATVTSIQEAAALKRLEQSYKDATEAANAYIDTIAKRNQRELAGIGQGSRARETQAGLNEIEDRLTATRRRLEGEQRRGEISAETFAIYLGVAQDTYQKEVELYNQRTAAITAAESNWVNGAKEALSNYADEAKNVAKQTEELFTKAFQGLEDALVEFANTGKLNFKSLATSIASDLNRMAVKQYITGPLAEMMKGGIASGPLGSMLGAFFPKAAAGAAGSVAGAAGKAAEGTAFTTAVTAAGTGFSTAVTASGTALTAEMTAGGAALTAGVTAAGAAFTAEVTAAGAAFAASVAAAGAASAAGAAAGGAAIAGFATGTAYVPQTGLYQLHQGERVIPAAQNAAGGGGVVINMPVTFTGPQDQRSVAQGLAKAGRMLSREVARGTAA